MPKPTCIDCGAVLGMKAAFICEDCARKNIPEDLQERLNPAKAVKDYADATPDERKRESAKSKVIRLLGI